MKNFVIVLFVIFLAAAAYYFLVMREPESGVEVFEPVVVEEPVPAEPPPQEAPSPEPVDEIVEEEWTEVVPLPELAESDPVVLESLSEAVGEEAVQQYVVTDNVVNRLVATINALSGRQVSANLLPVNPPDTEFEANVDFDPPNPLTNPLGDPLTQYIVDPVNYERYTPYVELLDSVSMDRLAANYLEKQPLFQEAYAQLGYPQGDFNARLLAVIDEMLAAPTPADPVRLIKPEAYYLFADPDLEKLPAGQKLMIRMGPDNARRVKAKLREFRAALVAAGLN